MKGKIIGLRNKKHHIMSSNPIPGLSLKPARTRHLPNNLTPEISPTKHSIHHQLQIMRHCRITMQVDASSVFKKPSHLQQADSHISQIRLIRISHSRLHHTPQPRMPLLKQINPLNIHIIQSPRILKLRTSSLRPNRSRIISLRIKRRIQINQIHTPRIQPPHNRQIIASPNSTIHKISHNLNLHPTYTPDNRLRANSTASTETSQPTARLPNLLADTNVDPDPQNGSNTTPPLTEHASTTRSNNFKGF